MTLLLAIAILALELPAQGQGGFGGGGFGGGAGGIAMGTDPGREQAFKHILTPGDKTEWPFDAKEGEVLILKAESENFDPGIEVVDAQGAKIGENDDEEPGKQNALLLVYIGKSGSYKARVKNYRSTAGGQYTFRIRRFQTTTIPAGTAAIMPSQTESLYVRIVAPKGEIVSLGNSMYNNYDELLTPSGKPLDWLPTVDGQLDRAFRVEEEGAYYARTRLPGREGEKATLSVRVARVHRASRGVNPPSKVGEGELDVWKIPAKAGEFLVVSAQSDAQPEIGFEKREADPNAKPAEDPFMIVSGDSKWTDTAVVSFRKDGDYEFYVRARSGILSYTLRFDEAWRLWSGVGQLKSELPVGGIAYYGIDVKPGTIERLEAHAKTFDIQVELFDAMLRSKWASDDSGWRSTDVADTVFLPDGGRYYLAVSCLGGGGGGAFELKAQVLPPKALKLGEWGSSTLAKPLDGLWSIVLERLQTYAIRVKGAMRVVVTDPKGHQVPTRSVAVAERDTLVLFDASGPGEYRVWLQSWDGSSDASLRVDPIDPESRVPNPESRSKRVPSPESRVPLR